MMMMMMMMMIDNNSDGYGYGCGDDDDDDNNDNNNNDDNFDNRVQIMLILQQSLPKVHVKYFLTTLSVHCLYLLYKSYYLSSSHLCVF